jgi:MFS family permease
MTEPSRAWAMAWALAVTETVSYGILFYSYGVFITPMENELGFTRAQSSGAFSIALLVAGLAAIGVGRWTDKYGARGVMTLGSILGFLLILAWSQIHSLAALYAVWIGIGLAMSGVFYDVAFTVIAVWFQTNRQQAILIITLVAGLASTIFIPLETYLVASLGWRQALIVLAGILALVTIPLHALVLRHKPHSARVVLSKQSAKTVLQSSTFWWLVLSMAMVRIAASALSAHTRATTTRARLYTGLSSDASRQHWINATGRSYFLYAHDLQKFTVYPCSMDLWNTRFRLGIFVFTRGLERVAVCLIFWSQ